MWLLWCEDGEFHDYSFTIGLYHSRMDAEAARDKHWDNKTPPNLSYPRTKEDYIIEYVRIYE